MTESTADETSTRAERRRRRALSVATSAVALAAVTGAAIATSLGGSSEAAVHRPMTRAEHHALAKSLSSAASARSEAETDAPAPATLTEQLAALLEGHGVVKRLHDFYPWGKEPVGDEPTLADGTPGRGGAVQLDGRVVTVIIHPATGSGCGRGKGDVPLSCESEAGGFLHLEPWFSESADGPSDDHGTLASFTKDGLEVVVSGAAGVDDSALIALAENPAWQ